MADVLETYLRLIGVGQMTSGFHAVGRAVKQASDDKEEFDRRMSGRTIGAGAVHGAISLGIVKGLNEAVQAAGKFEGKVISFNRLFGQGEGFSRGFLKQLQDFSLTTQYSFADLSEYAVRLKAMGFTAEEIIPIFRTLGDANAVLNMGSKETFERILLAIGQIRTRGKAVQQEINQLTQAQVPAFEILQKKLGLTGQQMGELGRQGIKSKVVLDALFSAMQEDYGGAMAAQMGTLEGQIALLNNEWNQFLQALGKPMIPAVVGGLRMLTGMMKGWGQLGEVPARLLTGAAIGVAGASGIMAAGTFLKMGGLAMAGLQNAAGVAQTPGALALAEGGGLLGLLRSQMGGGAGGGIGPALMRYMPAMFGLAIAAGGIYAGMQNAGTVQGQQTGVLSGLIGGGVAGAQLGAMTGLPYGVLGGGLIGALAGGLTGYYMTRDAAKSGEEDPGQKILQQIADNTKATADNTSERTQAKVVSGGEDLRRPFPESSLQGIIHATR